MAETYIYVISSPGARPMRYVILLSAVMMQMCLGATYSWSVYVQPLKALTGLQQGPVQIPFTTFYFIFPLTMMLAGTILPKIGPRLSAIIGGFLFGSGWLLARQCGLLPHASATPSPQFPKLQVLLGTLWSPVEK